jgi:hypothetical protein
MIIFVDIGMYVCMSVSQLHACSLIHLIDSSKRPSITLCFCGTRTSLHHSLHHCMHACIHTTTVMYVRLSGGGRRARPRVSQSVSQLVSQSVSQSVSQLVVLDELTYLCMCVCVCCCSCSRWHATSVGADHYRKHRFGHPPPLSPRTAESTESRQSRAPGVLIDMHCDVCTHTHAHARAHSDVCVYAHEHRLSISCVCVCVCSA